MSIDTKTALLDAADTAARSRGIDGFSFAHLAADVGIRKASVHHHFPSKAVLSVALMQRYHRAVAAACADIDLAHPSGGARLNALISLYHDALMGGESLCLCVAFSVGRESLPDGVIAEIGAFRRMMAGWLENAFALGLADGSIAGVTAPAAEATATLALLEGAQLAARAEADVGLFEAAVGVLRSRITIR